MTNPSPITAGRSPRGGGWSRAGGRKRKPPQGGAEETPAK